MKLSYHEGLLDLTKPDVRLEVMIRQSDGKARVWINVDGKCLFRASQIDPDKLQLDISIPGVRATP